MSPIRSRRETRAGGRGAAGAGGSLRAQAGSFGVAWLAAAAVSVGALASVLTACASTSGRSKLATSSSGPAQAAAPVPEAAQASPEPGPAVPQGEEQAVPQAVIEETLGRLARARGLAVRRPVHGRLASRRELAEHAQSIIRRELSEAELAGAGELLIGLGVVPLDFDYLASFTTLLGSELAGLYDQHEDVLYLARDLEDDELELTLSHELVHALQDQHFELDRYIRHEQSESDRISAVHALVEGEATSAMFDELRSAAGSQLGASGDFGALFEAQARLATALSAFDVPSIVKRSAVAPYVDGLGFVQALRQRGGWRAVDQAWQRPPRSTEQLLHSDKYLADEPPEVVEAPAPPPGGPSSLLYRDTLGEQGLRLVLEEWLPASTAARSATGWAGDQLAVWREGARVAMALRLRFDDRRHAERGAEALARTLAVAASAGRGAPPARATEHGTGARAAGSEERRRRRVCRMRAGVGPMALVREGRDVALAIGPYSHDASAAVQASCAAALSWASSLLGGAATPEGAAEPGRRPPGRQP